jgi:hypothetical protein
VRSVNDARTVNNFVLNFFRFDETKEMRDESVWVQIPAWILGPGRQDLPQLRSLNMSTDPAPRERRSS